MTNVTSCAPRPTTKSASTTSAEKSISRSRREYGGKSQLNLGHPVDSDRQPRGEGFELRTDSRGAIRAQKGIFISADGQAQAQGQVLDMEPAVSNLAEAREQMMSISGDAQKATANPADLRAQITLLEQQLTDLKNRCCWSARRRIALTSGEHLQVSAGHNLIATAGKNADVSVVKNLFIGVGGALSVFVRKAWDQADSEPGTGYRCRRRMT